MSKKTDPKNATPSTDIIIIGAGMAGLSLAALLGQAKLSVTVIDREDPEFLATEAFDSRTVALSVGTRAILEPLGIWNQLEADAEAITTIDVQEGHDPFVLNFDAQNEQGAFGWILPNTRVRKVLYDTARQYGVRFVQGALKDIDYLSTASPAKAGVYAKTKQNKVIAHENGSPPARGKTESSSEIAAILMDGSRITAQLLIGADGRMSRVRDILGFDTVNLDYKQTAWVGLIEHTVPHHGLALERFYPEGPFAALPFTDANGLHRSAIVWTRHAPKKMPVPDLKTVSDLIAPLLDDRYGTATAVGKWAAYPLGLTHAKQFIQDRVALISDAAHAMHPIAGQGLNVGMRDVKVLADLLRDASDDFGAAEILQIYQRARRFDVMAMMAATDVLNRFFANKIWPVQKLRSFGLGLVDRVPPLKKFFTDIATGT